MKFLSLEKEVFGLDISDRSVKLIFLQKKKRGFKLAACNRMELGPGIVEGGVIRQEDALARVIEALYKSSKEERIKTRYVAVNLPEEKSFLQVIQMPKMSPKDLISAVPFEAENYIPLPIGEVYLDFETINPAKGQNHLDILIVAAPKKIVNSYVSCLKKAGLTPVACEIESQAIARALIPGEDSSQPIIIIDIGKTSTDFIVFSGKSIQFTASLPISSEQITAAVAKSLDISKEKAEKLKVKFDLEHIQDAKSEKLAQAAQAFLESLVDQVKKYINFYQDHAAHEHLSSGAIEKIILCGGGANLKGLPEFLQKKLSIPVHGGEFWAHVVSKKFDQIVSKDPLSFTTAMGLALREFNHD